MGEKVTPLRRAFGVVIVAHGGLAEALRATVEHVLGPIRPLRAVSVGLGDLPENKIAEIIQALNDVDAGEGAVLVTDMFGGTPSNLAMASRFNPEHKVMYGANMPALIKLVGSRNQSVNAAIAAAIDAGQKYMGVGQGASRLQG